MAEAQKNANSQDVVAPVSSVWCTLVNPLEDGNMTCDSRYKRNLPVNFRAIIVYNVKLQASMLRYVKFYKSLAFWTWVLRISSI